MPFDADIWTEFLSKVQSRVSVNTYLTWFQSTKFNRFENETAYIQVSSNVVKKVLGNTYVDVVQATLHDMGLSGIGVKYIYTEEIAPSIPEDQRLIAVDVLDFLKMQLDPIDFTIEPILPVSNSGMIFAPTGVGKTYIMLHMAYSVAIGAPQCFVWDIPRARPVVYVDGEMDQLTLQERQAEIARAFHPVYPERGYMKIITPDQQPKYPPRINTKEGRARIEEHFQPGCFAVLDNIVTLCPGGDEKESEDWSVIQEWILYLRRNRISLFMVQHAGKSGDQIGTSKKEIQLSCNLKLTNQNHYTPEDGLRVKAELKKLRRRGKDGRWDPRWAQPFEIAYRVVEGAAEFSTRPMKGILKKQAVELLVAGAHPKEVMEATGLDRFVVYRLKKTLKDSGIAAAEASE